MSYNHTDRYFNQVRAENLSNADSYIISGKAIMPEIATADHDAMCGTHHVPRTYWTKGEQERFKQAIIKKAAAAKAEQDHVDEMLADFEARHWGEA